MDRPVPAARPHPLACACCLLLPAALIAYLCVRFAWVMLAMVTLRALVAWVDAAILPMLPVLIGFAALAVGTGGSRRRASSDQSAVPRP